MYGDARSAYDNKINLITEYNPHMLVTGDYNSDGNVDIAYTDTLEGIVSVLFGNDKRRFSEEFVLFRKNVSALTSFYSKFITGIAALDMNGYIYIVSQLGSFSEDVSIAAGIKPGVLSVFDYLNDGLNDLCFIDEERAVINFLVRNNEGLPHKLYQSKLHFPHREIITDDYSKEVKVFYCWTSGEKLIEIITADFGKNEFKKRP